MVRAATGRLRGGSVVCPACWLGRAVLPMRCHGQGRTGCAVVLPAARMAARRFCWRPAAVLFGATESAVSLPTPVTVTPGSRARRAFATLSARCRDSGVLTLGPLRTSV